MERIHHLFNELHRELVSQINPNADGDSITREEAQVAMIAFRLDALHHDFTDATTLKEEIS